MTKGLAFLVLSLAVFGCTAKFEEYNTNPYAPTMEHMEGDNQWSGTFLKEMMIALCQGQQNDSQMIEQLIGSEYGAMTTPPRQWSNGGNVDYAGFNPTDGNCNSPFNTIMPQISTGYFRLKDFTGGEGEIFAIATILRVAGTHRLSDIYGPVPYSRVDGESYSVAYDREEDLYGYLLADMDAAIETLSAQAANGVVNTSIAEHDIVFGGDYKKWVKFANTLKLRMAMRMKTVKPDLARQVVQEVQEDVVGPMAEAGDAAWSGENDGMNPYYRAAYAWGSDLRINANIVLVLNAYNDPRLQKYATPATHYSVSGQYVGVYPGAVVGENTQSTWQQLSNVNIAEGDKQLIMSASEAWFLEAEAALEGWWTKNTAQYCYEQGIRVSMEERGCSLGDYLTRSVPASASYNCLGRTGSIGMPQVAVSGNPTVQQIVTQKWLANFPNGWETWADIRRTGYPSLLPAARTNTAKGVTSIDMMRRLTYSTTEYGANETNVKAAVQMLKDPTDAFTSRLWWDND